MATPKRTPGNVIEQAISENRFGERLLYLFSCTSFLQGFPSSDMEPIPVNH